jgi:hypothetical protein
MILKILSKILSKILKNGLKYRVMDYKRTGSSPVARIFKETAKTQAKC